VLLALQPPAAAIGTTTQGTHRIDTSQGLYLGHTVNIIHS
jgi:hypothetical protein